MLIHGAGAGASWVAAGAARGGRRVRERLGRRAGLRREHRHQLLQVRPLAGRTRGRLAFAHQVLEVTAAATAFVFKKRHGVF